jgi:hypothetical protein
MSVAVGSKFKVHNSRNTVILIALIVAISISLLLAGCVFMMNSDDPILDGTIHVRSEKELINAINNAEEPAIITLNKDIKLTKPLIVSSNQDITLTSSTADNNFKLIGATDQTTINVDSGVLHLAGITVTHERETKGLGVNVTEGGKLFMISGEISGNTGWGDRHGYGGGVAVYEGCFFEMTGGVIVDNSGSRFGGGVWVDGFFSMSGNAVIANNFAIKDGWGVFVAYRGVFNMTGNSMITNNNSGAWVECTGCGVFNNGCFEMSGDSVITNNYASGGGGVYNAGSFVMTGNSSITNNHAGSGGGVSNGGSFVMTGNSRIANNTADNGGGGGVFNEGCFEMSGGEISNNTADNGGGIYDCGNIIRMSGVITNNKATNIGNNIYRPDDLSNGQ